MAWMNQRNEFSDEDLKNLFDLQPGKECAIRTITWGKSKTVSAYEKHEQLQLIHIYWESLLTKIYTYRIEQSLRLKIAHQKKHTGLG